MSASSGGGEVSIGDGSVTISLGGATGTEMDSSSSTFVADKTEDGDGRHSRAQMLPSSEQETSRTKEGIDNPVFENDETSSKRPANGTHHHHDATSNGTFLNTTVTSRTDKDPTDGGKKEDDMAEAVNLELVNMRPFGNGINGIPVKKGDATEADMSDPYDEYFVPVNEHRKYIRGEKLYVTKDKRHPPTKRKCFCWGLGLVVLAAAILIAILAATGVILTQEESTPVESRNFGTTDLRLGAVGGGVFGTVPNTTPMPSSSETAGPSTSMSFKPPTTDMSPFYVSRALEGELTIDNMQFTKGLADKNATEFLNLATSLEEELKMGIFDRQTLNYGAADISVKVLEFMPGSVIVKYRIGWRFKQNIHDPIDPVTTETLKQRLQDHLRSHDGFLYNYRVPLHKLKTTRVFDSCQFDNGQCSHDCMFDYNKLDFTCVCPHPLILDNSGKTCIEPVSEPEPTSKPEPPPVHEDGQQNMEPKLEIETEPKSEPEPEPKSEPEPEPKSEPQPEPQPEVKPEPEPEPKSDHESETKSEDGQKKTTTESVMNPPMISVTQIPDLEGPFPVDGEDHRTKTERVQESMVSAATPNSLENDSHYSSHSSIIPGNTEHPFETTMHPQQNIKITENHISDLDTVGELMPSYSNETSSSDESGRMLESNANEGRAHNTDNEYFVDNTGTHHNLPFIPVISDSDNQTDSVASHVINEIDMTTDMVTTENVNVVDKSIVSENTAVVEENKNEHVMTDITTANQQKEMIVEITTLTTVLEEKTKLNISELDQQNVVKSSEQPFEEVTTKKSMPEVVIDDVSTKSYVDLDVSDVKETISSTTEGESQQNDSFIPMKEKKKEPRLEENDEDIRSNEAGLDSEQNPSDTELKHGEDKDDHDTWSSWYIPNKSDETETTIYPDLEEHDPLQFSDGYVAGIPLFNVSFSNATKSSVNELHFITTEESSNGILTGEDQLNSVQSHKELGKDEFNEIYNSTMILNQDEMKVESENVSTNLKQDEVKIESANVSTNLSVPEETVYETNTETETLSSSTDASDEAGSRTESSMETDHAVTDEIMSTPKPDEYENIITERNLDNTVIVKDTTKTKELENINKTEIHESSLNAVLTDDTITTLTPLFPKDVESETINSELITSNKNSTKTVINNVLTSDAENTVSPVFKAESGNTNDNVTEHSSIENTLNATLVEHTSVASDVLTFNDAITTLQPTFNATEKDKDVASNVSDTTVISNLSTSTDGNDIKEDRNNVLFSDIETTIQPLFKSDEKSTQTTVKIESGKEETKNNIASEEVNSYFTNEAETTNHPIFNANEITSEVNMISSTEKQEPKVFVVNEPYFSNEAEATLTPLFMGNVEKDISSTSKLNEPNSTEELKKTENEVEDKSVSIKNEESSLSTMGADKEELVNITSPSSTSLDMSDEAHTTSSPLFKPTEDVSSQSSIDNSLLDDAHTTVNPLFSTSDNFTAFSSVQMSAVNENQTASSPLPEPTEIKNPSSPSDNVISNEPYTLSPLFTNHENVSSLPNLDSSLLNEAHTTISPIFNIESSSVLVNEMMPSTSSDPPMNNSQINVTTASALDSSLLEEAHTTLNPLFVTIENLTNSISIPLTNDAVPTETPIIIDNSVKDNRTESVNPSLSTELPLSTEDRFGILLPSAVDKDHDIVKLQIDDINNNDNDDFDKQSGNSSTIDATSLTKIESVVTTTTEKNIIEDKEILFDKAEYKKKDKKPIKQDDPDVIKSLYEKKNKIDKEKKIDKFGLLPGNDENGEPVTDSIALDSVEQKENNTLHVDGELNYVAEQNDFGNIVYDIDKKSKKKNYNKKVDASKVETAEIKPEITTLPTSSEAGTSEKLELSSVSSVTVLNIIHESTTVATDLEHMASPVSIVEDNPVNENNSLLTITLENVTPTSASAVGLQTSTEHYSEAPAVVSFSGEPSSEPTLNNSTSIYGTSIIRTNAIPGFSKCAAGQFQCTHGTTREGDYCVPQSAKCDSINDCSDGSDELGCIEDGCPGNFQCASGQCLKRHLVCNGIVDCNDGSDEINCENWHCQFDELQCPSGRCVPVLWQCDSKPDCENHTDEFNCQTSCGNNEYLCPEGWCIPLTWRCNRIPECANGEDEKLCDCSLDQFKCNTGGCIDASFVCDGVEHCPDNSDEWECVQIDTMDLQIRTNNSEWLPVCNTNWTSDWSNTACLGLGFAKAQFTEKRPADSNVTKHFTLKPDAKLNSGKRLTASLQVSEESCDNLVEVSCQEFTCGNPGPSDGVAARLVGGNGAANGQWPSVAILFQNKTKVTCTATIISPRWLLSSYNCLHTRDKSLSADGWLAFGGGSMFEVDKPDTQVRAVSEIVPHPQVRFNRFLYTNDFALVGLKEPFTLTRYVGAICLPEKEIEPRQICVTAGWGYTSPGEVNFNQYLHYLPVPTIDLTDCNSTKHYAGFVSDNEICAGFTDAEKTPCYNDEGAPLMCVSEGGVWELQGILSYHSNCGRGYHPSIYSSVTAIRNWIEKTVGSRFERKSTFNVR